MYFLTSHKNFLYMPTCIIYCMGYIYCIPYSYTYSWMNTVHFGNTVQLCIKVTHSDGVIIIVNY